MSAAPAFAVTAIDLFERDVRLRLPFRFGAVTVRRAPQAFVRATIRDAAGRESTGWTAEMMIPKWFDKRPARTDDENVDDLRTALGLARDAYTSDRALRPAFGHAAHRYRPLLSAGAAGGLNALVMSYGAALADRAIIDAVCRQSRVSFSNAVRANLFALDAALAPDLADFDLDAFLASRAPAPWLAARHTVGLADPLVAADVVERPDDGLPVALDEVIARYGHRHFKLKLSGAPGDDAQRLARIASVLDALPQYVVTLDGNEQFESADALHALWRELRAAPALARFAASVLYVEQPLPRDLTAATDLRAFARDAPLLIDEADDTYDAFPRAWRNGYAGVSSKNCKGPYKSLVNAARCAAAANSQRLFVSAEDLTAQCGLAVQQDLALAGAIGVTHVERNGHHYVAGFAGQGASVAEQARFAVAHDGLYEGTPGATRLSIRDGRIALRSLDVEGFATAALPDQDSLAPMRVDAAQPARSLA
ncbi:MAG: mandelate racemase [Casimicrobiaceae bacterium]